MTTRRFEELLALLANQDRSDRDLLEELARRLGRMDPGFAGIVSRVEPLAPTVVPGGALVDRPGLDQRRLTRGIVRSLDRIQAEWAAGAAGAWRPGDAASTGSPGRRSDDPPVVTIEAGAAGVRAHLCLDRSVRSALSPGRAPSAPVILGALLFVDGRDRGEAAALRRAAVHAVGLHLSRQAAVTDLGCHQRTLELVSALFASIHDGPLSPLGVNRIVDSLAAIVRFDVLVLALPREHGYRILYRAPARTPAATMRQIRGEIRVALGLSDRDDVPIEEELLDRPGRRSTHRIGACSSIVLPLMDRGGRSDASPARGSRGLLGLYSGLPGAYTPRDLRLLGLLLPGLTAALGCGQSLYAYEEGRREQDEELTLARAVQSHLMPRQSPSAPRIEIAWAGQAARGIGGDLCDVVNLPDGRVGLAVLDVSGKGIAAALVQSLTRGVLRTAWRAGDAPSGVLDRLEQGLADDLETGRFITAAVAIVAPGARRMAFSTAGHEPILHLDGVTGIVNRLSTRGVPVGTGLGLPHQDGTVALDPGDLLLLYTDGVTECLGPRGERFGAGRLVEQLSAGAGGSADQLIRRLVAELDRFRDGVPQSDDVALVAARIL